MSGYLALEFNYPSLWGSETRFYEYALPVNLAWALLHWPSMLCFGLALLIIPRWSDVAVRRFRYVCVGVFFLLLFELDAKTPFLLFPKVDAVVAFILSFVFVIAIVTAALSYTGIQAWRHRTPKIGKFQLAGGVFELREIEVGNSYRRELNFDVELMEEIPEQEVCILAQTLANELIQTYPFDEGYNKVVKIFFRYTEMEIKRVGEIALNTEYWNESEDFPCYFSY